MSRHVILLTDAHEAPAYELIEALRLSGVQTLIEGLREAEVEAAMSKRESASVTEPTGAHSDGPPIAVLYEVVNGADMVELHTAMEHAKVFWPGTPLVACRRQLSGFHGVTLRSLDGATLKRLGFRAIADKAAQLPAILREIEGHGTTGELKLPELVRPPENAGAYLLPARMKSSSLRAAFELVSSLHFIGDQNSAAHEALARLVLLVNADCWTIFLISDSKGSDVSSLEAIAVRRAIDEHVTTDKDDWRRLLLGADDVMPGSESKSAKLAAAGLGTLKKKERDRYVVAVPLVCGERILGVLEGIRDAEVF